MKRTAVFIFLAFVSLTILSASYLVDSASLLSQSQREDIENALKRVSVSTGISTVIVTEEDSEYSYISDEADMIIERSEYGENGVILLLNMTRGEYYISTVGECAFIFNDRALSERSLEGVLFPYLSDGDYYRAFLNWVGYVEICSRYSNGENVTTASAERDDERSFDWGTSLFFSAALALFISCFIVFSGKRKLKNIGKVNNADDYVVPRSFVVKVHKDIFLYSNVIRVPKEHNDEHPGGGRTTFHSSPSGRSHGGRGGRF